MQGYTRVILGLYRDHIRNVKGMDRDFCDTAFRGFHRLDQALSVFSCSLSFPSLCYSIMTNYDVSSSTCKSGTYLEDQGT